MVFNPKMNDGQFAVMAADSLTGHVLTITGELYKNDNTPVYTIFDDINAAKNYIKTKQIENKTLEFCIYDNNHKLVEFWKAQK